MQWRVGLQLPESVHKGCQFCRRVRFDIGNRMRVTGNSVLDRIVRHWRIAHARSGLRAQSARRHPALLSGCVLNASPVTQLIKNYDHVTRSGVEFAGAVAGAASSGPAVCCGFQIGQWCPTLVAILRGNPDPSGKLGVLLPSRTVSPAANEIWFGYSDPFACVKIRFMRYPSTVGQVLYGLHRSISVP